MVTLFCTDCIALLLKNGADARCPDHDDNTPMDVAKNDAVKQLLQKSLRHLDLSAEKRGNDLGPVFPQQINLPLI